ncbi:dUTP diphosphatase [Bacillus sp. IITD106]|nr:dUTP diphosphatase [Bacillus sp. IITD106]
MNLGKLFELQRELDDHILEEHPELKGQNNLDWKILALQVELGECANEWRGFKKWSNDQEPRTGTIYKYDDEGRGTLEAHTNPLLEEYVDSLHFILSIGLELDSEIRTCVVEPFIYDENSITNQFIEINYQSHLVISAYEYKKSDAVDSWFTLFNLFAGLGEMLGFKWEEVEQAYIQKNEVNHARQESGY